MDGRTLTLVVLVSACIGSFASGQSGDPNQYDYSIPGRDKLFTRTLAGLAEGYAILDQGMKDQNVTGDKRELTLWHVLARIGLLIFDTTDTAVNTSIVEVVEPFGITITGEVYFPLVPDDPNRLQIHFPLVDPNDPNAGVDIPPGADPQAAASAINAAILPELEAILAELESITETPAPFQMILGPAQTGLASDVEVDYGDVLALKTALLSAKAGLFAAANPACDLTVDPNDLLFTGWQHGILPDRTVINAILDSYQNLLKILPTTGTARLAQMKQNLITALDAAAAALAFIEGEGDDQTDDLLQVDVTDPGYAPARARLSQLQTSLINGTAATYVFGSKQGFALRQGDQTIGQLGLRYGGPLGLEGEEGWLRLWDPNALVRWWDIDWFEVDGTRIEGGADAQTGDGSYWGWFEGTISSDGSQITDLTFNVNGYSYSTGWYNETIPGLSAERAVHLPIEVQFNPAPLFAGSVHPRDMLAQFDSEGDPIPGTIGHGLNNDPTLGGVLPGMTQQDWLPCGFEIWGGTTDYSSASGSWQIFNNINLYNYTKLGASDGGSLTVSGTYAYYAIVARGAFLLDAVLGSDGSSYNGPLVTGHTDSWWNITGAPDGQYAGVGADRFLDPGGSTFSGYVVVTNPGNWTGLTVLTDSGGAVEYELVANAPGGHGTVSPAQGTYGFGEVVALTATPDSGYCVKAWIGTDNDASTSTANAATMRFDRTVTVEFMPVTDPNDPKGYLQQGYQEIASESLSGLRQAYHYFHLARNDPAYANDPNVILWHVLGRIAMLFVDTNDVVVETSFLELAQAYGIQVAGNQLDALDVNVPLDGNGCYRVPAGVDPATATLALHDSILPELESILTELESISDVPTALSLRLDPNLTGLDREVEVDYGDVLALRAALHGFRAFLGWAGSYDLFVGPGSPLWCLEDWDLFAPKVNQVLSAYPSLLKVLPTAGCARNGSASLLEAKGDLIAALDNFFSATDHMANEGDPQEDDLLSLPDANTPDLTALLDELHRLRDSLAAGTAGTYAIFTTKTYNLSQGGQPVGTLDLVYGPGHLLWNHAYLSFDPNAMVPAPYWAVSFEVHEGVLSGDGAGVIGDPFGSSNIYNGYLEATLNGDQISSLRLLYFGTTQGEVTGLTASLTSSPAHAMKYNREIQYNPNPAFGPSPVEPRALLPQFDANSIPVPGTFGHGLGNDATGGGIFPAATQDFWLGSGYAVFGVENHGMLLLGAMAMGADNALPLNYLEGTPGVTRLAETSPGVFPGSYPLYFVVTRSRMLFDAIQSLNGDELDTSDPSAVTGMNLTPGSDVYDADYVDCTALGGSPDGNRVAVGNFGFLGAYTGFIMLRNPDPNLWTGLKITADSNGLTAPTFGSDSANFSDVPFCHAQSGSSRTYQGQARYAGTSYSISYSHDTLLGVNCLRISATGVPAHRRSAYDIWVARDAQGELWLFKLTTDNSADVFVASSLSDLTPCDQSWAPILRLMSGHGAVGTVVSFPDGSKGEVLSTTATLPQFPGQQFVQTRWTASDGSDNDYAYYGEPVGLVADIFDNTGDPQGNGWVLEQAPAAKMHDWNGDGFISIIGDVPPFVDAVYFQKYPEGWSQDRLLQVGDGNHDGILSIIGDVPCFVDCVYFGNCPE